jgi:hypothetical protein
MLAAFDWGEIQAVFCGGTSLSKGHGVIQRMSEDIDFKLALPTSWSRSQARRKLSACRKELAERMRAADFDLPEAGIVTLNENRYFCFSLGYLPQFPLVPALRLPSHQPAKISSPVCPRSSQGWPLAMKPFSTSPATEPWCAIQTEMKHLAWIRVCAPWITTHPHRRAVASLPTTNSAHSS